MCQITATREVVVTNPQGMHARPAEQFATLAQRFDSEIQVARGDHQVDAKSILNLLTLGAAEGVELTIVARGPDADAAIDALAELVASGFAVDETISQGSSP